MGAPDVADGGDNREAKDVVAAPLQTGVTVETVVAATGSGPKPGDPDVKLRLFKAAVSGAAAASKSSERSEA